jgi:hypothetical protein
VTVYLKTIMAGMMSVLLFLALRSAALRVRSAQGESGRSSGRGWLFWIVVVLCFLAGAALYSQLRGAVSYTAHSTLTAR